MALTINTNIASLNAQQNLASSQSALQTSLQRLSSGLRINSSKDDAAGLAISDRMTAQINGLDQATRNANDGVSLAQTADGSLAQVSNNLQTIRTLAVQAANSTNSATDRASLNAEAQQLLSEIQRVATSAQFNGQNILDGTFTSSQFQVGANANQTISASTGNAQTSALGSYQAAATHVTGTALASGNLLVNGYSVGASASGSAADIAAAINGVTNQSGVTAAATTAVTGSNSLHPGVAIQSGDLVINGVNIGGIGSSTTAAAQGAAIASAINQKSNATNVTAVANGTTGQITLNSATGQTIALTSSTAAGASRAEAASGLELTTATTYTNTLTFAGTPGVSTLNFSTTTAAADAFTVQGVTFTYSATLVGKVDATHYNVGGVAVGTANTDAASMRTALSLALTNGDIKDVTIGGAGAAATITSTIGTSSTTDTNVTGTGVANLASSTLNVGAAGPAIGQTMSVGGQTFEFLSPTGTVSTAGNIGVVIGANGTATATNFASALATQNANKLNFVTAAAPAGAAVTLTSNQLGAAGAAEVNGNNTAITGIGGTNAAGTGTTDNNTGSTQSTTYGTLELNSANTFSLTGTGLTNAGLTGGVVSLSTLSNVDISTVAGSNAAISLIDGALSQVDSIRGNLGALQNRFLSVVSSLTSSSNNLSAARSQIQDTNYAAETASMTRNQILQQAGVAMLAQANALPNLVLSLLK